MEEKQALRQMLGWAVLLLLIVLPLLIAILAIGFFGSVWGDIIPSGFGSLRDTPPAAKLVDFRPILTGISGLTPPGSCGSLATRVAGFEPQNSELFRVPYCLS